MSRFKHSSGALLSFVVPTYVKLFNKLKERPVNNNLGKIKNEIRSNIKLYITQTLSSYNYTSHDRCASDYRIKEMHSFIESIEQSRSIEQLDNAIKMNINNMQYTLFGSRLKSNVLHAMHVTQGYRK